MTNTADNIKTKLIGLIERFKIDYTEKFEDDSEGGEHILITSRFSNTTICSILEDLEQDLTDHYQRIYDRISEHLN